MRGFCRLAACCLLSALLAPASQAESAGTNPEQRTFESPGAAVDALVDATRNDRADELVRILGPDGRQLVYSGDPVADNAGRDRFVSIYDEAHVLRMDNGDTAILVLGEKQWPFPIPVVHRDGAWRFDTKAGEQEILDRRIGRNELSAIKVCEAVVDAQRDYAERVRGQNGEVEYASRFISTPGNHDGLYWQVSPGEAESPIGPLLADARSEGYGVDDDYGNREPYHGYYYRMLMRQGTSAHGGAYDYMVDGHLIGGFALVAFPANYGASGIMTFIVNQDGIVYQKNLGPGTIETARKMDAFDPDPTWQKAQSGNSE